jgi:CheY-like chemotaxis protein
MDVKVKRKVLVVDDEPANRRLLQKALEKNYEVKVVESAEDCINLLADFSPDVYLLDIMMPEGINGYELCEIIRKEHNTNEPLIIFLSALNDLKDKVKGYQVGADDYVTKPIEMPILTSKIELYFIRLNTVEKNSTESMSMAMTAMTNGSEIGQVNLFLENLNRADSYSAVAEEVIRLCNEYGISAAVQIRTAPNNINMSTTGTVNTLEDELMLAARNASRIYTFGRRCLFNFNGATLLVRGMPEDSDKAGRYRDHLASVMNGVEARGRSLYAELKLKSQNDGLVMSALKTTHETLDEIMRDFKRNDARSQAIISDLTSAIYVAFSTLDLQQEQEESLMDVIIKHTELLNESSSDGIKLDRKFETVINSLQQILNQDH